MKDSKCPYSIIYEDSNLLVVYKKRDVLSVATEDKKTYTHNLFFYLRCYAHKKGEEVYLVHRLDFETSGLIIFAKSPVIEAKLKAAFLEQKAIRDYEAVVQEDLPIGLSKHVELRVEEAGQKEIVSSNKDAKLSVTDLEVINKIQIGTALHISISTGRHNQIRLALAHLGYSLLGDTRYGKTPAKRLYLNEYHLGFPTISGFTQNDFSVSPLWLTSIPKNLEKPASVK